MKSQDLSLEFQSAIHSAFSSKMPLSIHGSGSKQFYTGLEIEQIHLNTQNHSGIIDYDPSELVLTVRSGTPLNSISQLLATEGQMLAFEPPGFGPNATIGGTLACGFSGPRRPFFGSARDYTLGCKIINGKGEILSFGGKVMKNVAGFDASRLMVGAMGTLGLILETSLKVLPKPDAELTLVQNFSSQNALSRMTELSRLPLPISGLCHVNDLLYIRIFGHPNVLTKVHSMIGGEILNDNDTFWQTLKEQTLDFFKRPEPLLRISLPPATPHLNCNGDWIHEWGGALRWLKTTDLSDAIAKLAKNDKTLVSGFDHTLINVEQALTPELLAIHQNLRQAFDPYRLFNRNCRIDRLIAL